jgi:NTE family protein
MAANGSSLLRNVQLLAGLDDELLARIEQQVESVRVKAGDWVLRRGERADCLYILRSGRVEVIDDGPPEVLVRMLRRGDVLGELALLGEGVRSASARARRDTELLRLSRDAFEGLITEAPTFALALTRAMGAQLAASLAPMATSELPRTVAVLGLDPGAPVNEVADQLEHQLAGYGSIASLSGGGVTAIEQAEADVDRVVLRAGSAAGGEWTRTCLHDADLVIAVTSGRPEREWLERADALHGCELLVLGPPQPPGTFGAIAPRELQVISDPARRADAIASLGRRLSGRSPGIVMSGGGARALAHLGVLEELRAAGLQIDRVAGVSLGSVVAAVAAAGFSTEGMIDTFQRGFVDTNPTNDYVPPAYAMLRGVKTRKLIEESFGGRLIEELALRFFCVSCDLVSREAVVHRDGPVSSAVYASLAIPGVFPPVATDDGRLLVDGGVLDNLPVETMAASGVGPVIAVDVSGRSGHFEREERRGLAPLARSVRHALTGSEAQIPRLGETIVRSVLVGSRDTVAASRRHADLTITPQVDGIGLLEWKALPRARLLGRRAAHEALEAATDLHERLGL